VMLASSGCAGVSAGLLLFVLPRAVSRALVMRG